MALQLTIRFQAPKYTFDNILRNRADHNHVRLTKVHADLGAVHPVAGEGEGGRSHEEAPAPPLVRECHSDFDCPLIGIREVVIDRVAPDDHASRVVIGVAA